MISFRKHLDEKLKATDKMGTWVKDFQDSDAPQFKGKSKEKRRQMAIAAKLDAEREAGMRKEEVELDESFASNMNKAAKKAHADAAEKIKKMGPVTRDTLADINAKLGNTTKKEEVELDEGILKPYHAIGKQPWSKTIKDSKGTAGEYKQIAKGKDFGVWYAYRGSNKSFPHYVVKDDKIIGSGMTVKSALKDAGLKEKDLTHRSKFADGSPLNKGMKEEVELDEAKSKAAPKMKGDWLKKERERNRAHDAAMGRTPTGRKKPVRQMTSTQKSLAKMRGEEVELDEVLDTPKAMDSYRNKAKYSKERAANSAAAKMLRNKNGFHSTDTSDELNTMDKRAKGLKMADRAAARKTRAMIMKKEEVELDEQTQFDLVEAYLLENNIDVDALSVEQLDEIIGKVVGGAFKVGAKAAVGAARRMSTAGRADAAEKRAAAAEKRNKDRERIQKARQRLRDAQNAARAARSGATT